MGSVACLRVLDLTTFLSGPFCTQLLGDLGADVIKVEPPEGDLTRALPPHFVGDDSAYFLSANRNKRSVVLDLKKAEGQALARALAVKSDVLVENFRPGVAARLGLSYETLSEENRGLVWCSISGFGQDGPYRDYAAYDMIVQAMAGVMSLTGEPTGRGVRTGIPLSDLAGGMYAAVGILAALVERSTSGIGQQIDIAMLDAVTSFLSYQGVYHLVAGVVGGRQGTAHDSIPTYRAFTASDGADIVITANTERMWRGLCTALGRPDLLADERFTTLQMRFTNCQALWAILEREFLTRSSHEWVAILRAADVPAATVNTVEDTLNDPQVLHRRMVIEAVNESGTRVRLLGNPVRMSATAERQHRFPPSLGADTDEVLREVAGLGDDELRLLREAGVTEPTRSSSGRG